MRMTKGMKKALSFVLAGAMVITGANFGVTKTASAADDAKTNITSYSVTFDFDGTDTSGLTFGGLAVANFEGNGTYTVDAKAMIDTGYIPNLGFFEIEGGKSYTIKNAKLTVNGIEFAYGSDVSSYAGSDSDAGKEKADFLSGYGLGATGTKTFTATDGSELRYVADSTEASYTCWGKGSFALFKGTSGSEEGGTGSNTSSGAVTSGAGMTGFTAQLYWVTDDGWVDQITKEISVTGNGEYNFTFEAGVDSTDLFMCIIDTDLVNGSTVKGFELKPTKITIGGKEVQITPNTGLWGFKDQDAAKSGFRYNIRNTYNGLFKEDCIDFVDGSVADIFAGQYVPVKTGDEIVVSFSVSGMDPEGEKLTYEVHEHSANDVGALHPTTNPGDNSDNKTDDTQNNTPQTSPTLKLNKTSAIVAAGKSVTVKATTNQSKITASTKNSKVATATVSGKNVKIAVPKTATKGASTTVTIQAGTKKATVKVTVQNKAKKIKAAKKTVTVKKGKKATLKFKVTATNKKKAAADTIKATSKNKKAVKVTKYSVKKGKATVTVKGVKKGKKATVTLKIGKKSAKVTVKVK